MRSMGPPLLPILRSQNQARLLAELLLDPSREASLSELGRRLSAPVSTLHLEVERLVEAGILSERTVGRNRLLRANTDSRLFAPLAELLSITYGPATVIAEEFGDLGGIRAVYIFGSWAARYLGVPGESPHDIDVMIVGTRVSRLNVSAASQRSEDRMRIPVQAIVVTPDRWAEPDEPLIHQIQSAPLYVVLDRDTEPSGKGRRRVQSETVENVASSRALSESLLTDNSEEPKRHPGPLTGGTTICICRAGKGLKCNRIIG
jgi:DNA-binding Lrp family transcriptional regulator